MQRRLRFLSFALCAGVVAIVAAAVPLIAATPAPTQLQYTRTSQAKMPGAMSMFVHPKAESTTTTIGPSRERMDSPDNTSQIIQCDLKRIIHLDNNAKTYYAMTFAQIQAQMNAAAQQYQHQMNSTTPNPHPAPASTIQGSGGLTISVTTVNDPNTQQILGMTAHHVTETITGTANGNGQCPNGTLTMINDEWYIPNPVTFSCPMARPVMPAMPPPPAQHGGGPAANPCLGSFQMQASGKARTEDRFALRQDTTLDLGVKITTHEEVTKYATQPYDPSFFDVPSGYTQVQPPQMGG